MSSTSATVQYDKRNNRMEPTKGAFSSLSEEFAGLGGNRNFVRSILDVRYYRPVLLDDLIFRTKGEAGNIYNYDGKAVQTGERFRLGGPNSLKGYDPFSVTPIETFEDGSGIVRRVALGAYNEAFYVAELEYPIVKDVGLKFVLFYDIGDAFDKLNEFSAKSSYGWGVRWFSPLGPLRFEWGYPIKPKSGDTSSVFNFMIGPPF
jgi:outer membrane protein insertion porin family